MCTFPAEVDQGDTPPSVSSHTVNECPLPSLFLAIVLAFLLISLLKTAPMHHAEILSSVLRGRLWWVSLRKERVG